MYYLFFDTETTGLPRKYNAPISDLDNWPRLVQLAWIVSDENGEIVSEHNYIIKPSNFSIPQDSVAVHGIDDFKARLMGQDLNDVLKLFKDEIEYTQPTLVAHNILFDINIVASEFLRNSIEHEILQLETICTMKSSVSFCALDRNRFPKLSDLHFKLFAEDFDNAHDALADVVACKRCFFELKKRSIIQ